MASVDSFLQHVERDALVACLVMAGAALAWPDGGLRAGVSVLAGGVLAGVSYRGLKAGISGIGGGTGRVGALVKFFTRHAILALAAYVMLARLRLHPLGLIAGASSLVVAVAVAAARTETTKSSGTTSRSGHPR
ncbi:MAG TPA: hypothetical protein VF198_12885 [Vicinamibacterales bacterium]